MSGIFGCFDTSSEPCDVAKLTYYGIFSLQHRGQESAGIAVNNNGSFVVHKQNGMVVDTFDNLTLSVLKGSCAIAHTRFSSNDVNGTDVIQPIQIKSKSGQIALSASCAILNENSIRDRLKKQGAIFQTNTDTEVILSLFSRNRINAADCEDAVVSTMHELRGAYSMIFMTESKIIGVRDPLGIRPLVLGRKGDIYMLSSETCAFDAVGAEVVRDVLPGEVITLSNNNVSSRFFGGEDDRNKSDSKNGKICIFEYVYLARPDSVMDGCGVYESRYNAGKALAEDYPCDCDIVIGAPDSGIAAAVGYAAQSGIPYGSGLLKNRYVGRSFIKSTQDERELSVRLKFAALKSAINGKRVCLVDDSIVRGTTMNRIIKFLRDAGATEIHLRIASPAVKYPCWYAVGSSVKEELPASHMSVDEIRDMVGADSLGFLSLEKLKASLEGITCGQCAACFDGIYPAGIHENSDESVHSITYTEGK